MNARPFQDIEATRERFGISQVRLCRNAGVSEATYYRAKMGGVPRKGTLKRLTDALAVLIDEKRSLLRDQLLNS